MQNLYKKVMEVLLVAIVAVILTPLELISGHIVLLNSVLNSVPYQTTKLKREIPSASVPDPGPEPPLTWTENWTVFDNYHNQNLTRVYLNKIAHVAVYFDPDVHPNSTWIFEFTSNVWAYMTQSYSHFGPDPYLCVIIHQGRYKGGHKASSLYGERNMHNKRNVIDEASLHPYGWHTGGTRSDEMTQLTKRLAYFVEFSSKERRGSPSRNVWTRPSYKDTAWVDIFTYDVLMNLNLTSYADQFNSSATMKSEIIPRKYTFWFRDWLLPIYKEYGGREVLNKYFVLLKWNFPAANDIYVESLNMGEFVHFWSGAAGFNLIGLAKNAFGWNGTYQEQFLSSRERFPTVTSLYKYDDPSAKQMSSENGLHPNNFWTMLGVSFTITAFLLLCTILIGCLMIYRKKLSHLKQKIRTLTEKELQDFFEGVATVNNTETSESHDYVQSLPFVKKFEIPRDQIIIAQDKVIGSGQFGCIVHGFVRLPQCSQLKSVAIKMMKPEVDVLYFKDMLSEVKIMAYLDNQHENIVKLLGTCTANIKNGEIFMALELCPLGNLENYLKNNRHNFTKLVSTFYIFESCKSSETLWFSDSGSSDCGSKFENEFTSITFIDLVKWAQEIANAMVYLTQKKVIHGDLAARNVLLTGKRVAKISDFGLSRQFLNYENYMKTSKTPVPWKWLAIECLKEKKFSVASDVWAFGITLWEIFSLAEIPYPGWTYDFNFVNRLINGDRLELPEHANEQLYQLMLDCWNAVTTDRPSFLQIRSTLEEIEITTTSNDSFKKIRLIVENNELLSDQLLSYGFNGGIEESSA